MHHSVNDEPDFSLDYLSPDAERGRAAGGRILCEATRIAAGSQGAGAKDKIGEPLDRKGRARFHELARPYEEDALLTYMEAEGFYVREEDFKKAFGKRAIGGGTEQTVYLATDGINVIKANGAVMHGTWLEFFNRIALHNWLFPECAYLLLGFTHFDQEFQAIIRQPFLHSERGAGREEVAADLAQRGFQPIRNDDYYSPSLGIILEGLHDENVLVSDGGLLLYFDPIAYLETPEMKLAGRRVYRYPF